MYQLKQKPVYQHMILFYMQKITFYLFNPNNIVLFKMSNPKHIFYM